jgi:hypothetical protein
MAWAKPLTGEIERVYRQRYRRFLRVATAILGDETTAHDAVQDGFAQALPTAADKLDPKIAARLVESNKALGLEADSARFVTQLADGVRIYAIATKTGGLCVLAERLPNNNGKSDAGAMGCGSPLTHNRPSTAGTFQANERTPPIS